MPPNPKFYMDSNDDNVSNDFAPLVYLLRQIIEVLETSSIAAEERGEDLAFKFWFAYKKISGEYDNNMYERCNGNMEILMLFAGLFSAVNTAFIIAMQPNPADTTNDLLVQFMQNSWNGSSLAQPVALSAPVAYSSSKIWMQVLAYTSLTFSLLAAFGAVLGKQWLNHYKTNRFDGGRLKQRCQQRHRKFQKLEEQYFERVLQSFPVLLQISLILFILSLAAATWMQHRIVSLFIILPTACSFILFVFTIVASLKNPDSPFQSWISLAIRCLLPNVQIPEDSTTSAMSWILDTSTNPDVFSLALDLMVAMSNQQQHDMSDQLQHDLPNTSRHILPSKSPHDVSDALIKKVLGMFKACFDSTPSDKGNVMSLGRALIHISWKCDGAMKVLDELAPDWEYWPLWRKTYFPSALEQCSISFRRMKETADSQDQTNVRTALRMALGAGMNRFVNPDKEYSTLVWEGQFGLELDSQDVDWLMDCAKYFHAAQEFEAAGDALLLFSSLKDPSHITQAFIIPFLNSSPRSFPLRHSALHAASQVVDIHSPCDPSFSKAVLTAVSPPTHREYNGSDLFAYAISLLEAIDWSRHDPPAASPLINILRLVFLVLPAPSLDNTVEFDRYRRILVCFMYQDTGDFKRVALRNAYRIRRNLVTITGTPSPSVAVPSQNETFSKLLSALLTMVLSKSDRDHSFHYAGLIFTLASHLNWLPDLDQDRHIKKCIKIIPDFYDQPPSSFFYLAGIFLRAYGQPVIRDITTQQWWNMTRMAWHAAGRQNNDGSDVDVLDDGVDILEALVTATKSHMPPKASKSDLEFLRNGLDNTIKKLESRQSPPPQGIILAMEDLKRHEPS